MKNNKGFFVVIGLLFIFTSLLVVNADQSQSFNVTSPALTAAVGNTVTADNNYSYGFMSVTHTTGDASANVGLQAYYHADYHLIANKTIAISNGKSAKISWYPNNKTNWPSGTTDKINCSSSINSDNYCIIKSTKYRVYTKNNNWLNSFTVSGSLKFTNN